MEHDQDLWERPTTSSARSYEDDPGPSDPDGNRQGQVDIDEQLRSINGDKQHVFKINSSMGVVLRNAEGELCYFFKSGNESVLAEHFQISSQQDVDKLILR